MKLKEILEIKPQGYYLRVNLRQNSYLDDFGFNAVSSIIAMLMSHGSNADIDYNVNGMNGCNIDFRLEPLEMDCMSKAITMYPNCTLHVMRQYEAIRSYKHDRGEWIEYGLGDGGG